MNTHEDEYEPLVHTKSSAKHVLKGMFVGSLVGAAAMLLFAPQSGEETRAEVQKGATDLRDRATEKINMAVGQVKSKANQITTDAQGKAEELKHEGKHLVARQLERVSHAAEAGKKAVEEV